MPFCVEKAYVVDENRCALCGEVCEDTCAIGGNAIPVSELSDDDVCGYCQHTLGKDD